MPPAPRVHLYRGLEQGKMLRHPKKRRGHRKMAYRASRQEHPTNVPDDRTSPPLDRPGQECDNRGMGAPDTPD
jgi:hypothetical protein